MLQTLVIFASEAAEPSKVPFYVAGGILAAWAVAITAVGMRSETFPGSDRGVLGVVGVSAVLVAAAMYAAIVTG